MNENIAGLLPAVTVECGQTDYGTGRVKRWTREGVEELGKFRFRWRNDPSKAIGWYNEPDVSGFWNGRHVEWIDPSPEVDGKSILDLTPGVQVFTGSIWGADMGGLNSQGKYVSCSGMLYRALYDTHAGCEESARFAMDQDPGWWHRTLNRAGQMEHQPIGNIHAILAKAYPKVLSQIVGFAPMADILFAQLTDGRVRHDRTMAQTLGLLTPQAREGVEGLFREFISGEGWLCPGEFVGEDWVFDKNGMLCVPMFHDSVGARNVCLMYADFGLYSGSWSGQCLNATGLDIELGETLDAGLSNEGLSPLTLQQNVAMLGPLYERLKAQSGLSHDAIDEALGEMGAGLFGFPDLPNMVVYHKMGPDGPEQDIGAALESAGKSNTAITCLATVINYKAKLFAERLKASAKVAGKSLNEVAIVGGWSLNKTFLACLKHYGLNVLVPPGAENAADLGAVTEALRRAAVYRGLEVSTREIHEAMSELFSK